MNPKRLWGLAVAIGIPLVLLGGFSYVRLAYAIPCDAALPCTAYRDLTRDTYFILAEWVNPVPGTEGFVIRDSSVILAPPQTTVFSLGFVALADDKAQQVRADGPQEKGNHFNAHLSLTARTFSFNTKSGGHITVRRMWSFRRLTR